MSFICRSLFDLYKRTFCVCDFETFIVFNRHYIFTIGLFADGELHIFRFRRFFLFDLSSFFVASLNLFEYFLLFLKCFFLFFVYFHNFSSFDGLLLLDYFLFLEFNRDDIAVIIKENKIYEIKIFSLFILKDSYLLLPESLNFIANVFGGDSKDSLDFKFLNIFNFVTFFKFFFNFFIYFEKDLFLLFFIINRVQFLVFKNYSLDICLIRTLPSLSFKIYRIFFLFKGLLEIIVNDFKENFVRCSYFGGLSEVYKPFGTKLFYYDVNSLYPYVMLFPMPVGIGCWLAADLVDFETFFGFLNVEVESPETYFGFLPYKLNNVLLSPYGIFRGIYFSEEVRFCMKNYGYSIKKIFSGLSYNSERIFVSFINYFYNQKLFNRLIFNKSYSFLSKLILNSCYGRFALKNSISETFLLPRKNNNKIFNLEIIGELTEKCTNSSVFCNFNYNKNNLINLYKMNSVYEGYFIPNELISLNNKFLKKISTAVIAPQISSAITAYARILMYKLKFFCVDNSLGCLYTDTDSIVVDGVFNLNYISVMELGKLKVEYSLFTGYFLAPKMYYIYNTFFNKKVVKGVGLFEVKTINIFWFNSKLKKNYLINYSLFGRKNVSFFKLNSMNMDYIYTFNLFFNKRIKIYDLKGIWCDTAQLSVFN